MMSDKFRLNMNNKKSYYNLSVWENNRIWYVGMVMVLYHLLHCMQLPSFHDYLVFVMTQLSKNLNFVEIPTTSVGASPDLDSMGESESESRLGLYPCGLGPGLWSHGLGLGLHPGGFRLTVSPGESGEKCTRQI